MSSSIQTMSTYISLEPQFNADQSFHGNYGLKMYGFQVTGGQSLPWHRHFSEEYFCCFFWHILTYIPLERQFIAEQSFHGNYGLKMYDFQVTRGQSLPWHRHFSEEYFCFFLTYINLHTVGTAIYCWAKFPWEPWSKSVWFSRYKGSDQWWRHHISNECS